MEKMTITITSTKEFSNEEINDLVSTALEGGINYWCRKAVISKHKENGQYIGVMVEDVEKVQFISDVISYGGTLKMFDAESDDIWYLDIEKLLKGIKMFCEGNNISLSNLMDVYDAETADMIVQYALFGEQVFA